MLRVMNCSVFFYPIMVWSRSLWCVCVCVCKLKRDLQLHFCLDKYGNIVWKSGWIINKGHPKESEWGDPANILGEILEIILTFMDG